MEGHDVGDLNPLAEEEHHLSVSSMASHTIILQH